MDFLRALSWRPCCNPIIASKDSNEIASSAPPPLLELDTVVVGRVVIPVPLSATVCVPAPLPALTLSIAVADAAEAGLNTTLIVQVAPTATELPQLLVCENGCEPVVESVMLVIGSATVPLFVTVTDLGALATFVVSLPNATEPGDAV